MKTRARAERSVLENPLTSPRKMSPLRSAAFPTPLTPATSPARSVRNGQTSRVPRESTPDRRKKVIATVQADRMKIISKALEKYTGDIDKLFDVIVWMGLIREAVKGSAEERKYSDIEKVRRVANLIMSQIVTSPYAERVGKILSAAAKRGGRSGLCGSDRATEFLMRAQEYDTNLDEKTWNKATGRIHETSPINVDNFDVENSPNENVSVNLENEAEGEKENAEQTRRRTRNSSKSQLTVPVTPLKVKSSQINQTPKNSGWSRGKVTQPPNIHELPTPIVATVVKDSSDRRTFLDDSLDVKPHTPSPRRSPSLFDSGHEDEIIENDTPPPTPLTGFDQDTFALRKRSRLSSSRDSTERERPPSVNRTYRSGLRSDVLTRQIQFEDIPQTSRSSFGRLIMESSSFYGISKDSSSSNSCLHDLPDLEFPDTGRTSDKENLQKSEQEILRDFPKPLGAPELRPQMFEEIEYALAKPRKHKVVHGFRMSLRQEQLAIYNRPEWLEDANIDFYLEMIRERNNQAGSNYPNVYVFHSYFYKLLEKSGYKAVEGTTDKDDIFLFDLVLIPIHSDSHWVLVAIDFDKKEMSCYDSMDHNNDKHLRVIAGYIKRHWKERKTKWLMDKNKNCKPIDVGFIDDDPEHGDYYLGEGWEVRNLGASDIPQQTNGRDCGIFCLQFAEYLSRKAEFDFEQRHAAYFRKRMLYETIKGSLLIS